MKRLIFSLLAVSSAMTAFGQGIPYILNKNGHGTNTTLIQPQFPQDFDAYHATNVPWLGLNIDGETVPDRMRTFGWTNAVNGTWGYWDPVSGAFLSSGSSTNTSGFGLQSVTRTKTKGIESIGGSNYVDSVVSTNVATTNLSASQINMVGTGAARITSTGAFSVVAPSLSSSNVWDANNVKYWGAGGNGATYDSAAIASAVAHVASLGNSLPGNTNTSGGGTVKFPKGVYLLTNSIDLYAYPWSDISLEGDGPETVLLMVSNDVPIIKVSEERKRVSNLTLRYNTQQTTAQTNSVGLMLNNVVRGEFKNLWIQQAYIGIGGDMSLATNWVSFSCLFQNLTLNGYSGYGIHHMTPNASSSGDLWLNTYVHNGYPIGTTNYGTATNAVLYQGEADFAQLNVEAGKFSESWLKLQSCRRFGLNGFHTEQCTWLNENTATIEAIGTTLLARGLEIESCTVDPGIPNQVGLIRAERSQVSVNGLRELLTDTSGKDLYRVMVFTADPPIQVSLANLTTTYAEKDLGITAAVNQLPYNISADNAVAIPRTLSASKELLYNPLMETTLGWTTIDNGGITTNIGGGVSGNYIVLTNNGTVYGKMYNCLTNAVVGEKYQVSVYFKKGSLDAGQINVESALNAADLSTVVYPADVNWTAYVYDVVATTTNIYLRLGNPQNTSGGSTFWDSASIKRWIGGTLVAENRIGVGTGTNGPQTALHVNGSVLAGTAAPSTSPAFKSSGTNNLILTCPSGGSWILRVANDGTLSTVTNSAGL